MDPRLKTPRRYKSRGISSRYRSAGPSPWRKYRVLFLLVMVVGAGYFAYLRRDQLPVYVPVINPAPDAVSSNPAAGQANNAPVRVQNVSEELAAAELNYATGDFETAITHYRNVIPAAPNNLLAHTHLAYALIVSSSFGSDEARLNEALQIADKAINASPEDPEGWGMKAMALLWMDRGGEAIAYATRALELDPTYIIAKAFLAQAYWNGNRPELAQQAIDEAIAYLNEVGRGQPEVITQVFRTQGYILSSQADRDGALAAYQKAANAAPNQSYLTAELALSYWNVGNRDQAMQMLTAELAENPRDPTLLFWMGRFQSQQNEVEVANETFQRCLEADPNHTQCLSWLGGNKFYAAQYTDAVTYLQRAVDNDTSDLEAWAQLGSAYSELEQCPQAVEVWQGGYQKAEAVGDEDIMSYIDALMYEKCGAEPE